MDRRALLAALGAGAAGLAGCISTDDVTAPTDTPDGTTGTDAGTETEPDEPTPDSEAVTLTASDDAAALPTATLSFTLRNESAVDFATNFYGWQLHKRVGDGWVHVTPRAVPEPLMYVGPGGSHAWTLNVDNTRLGREDEPQPGGTDDIAIAGLGPGTYEFRIDGWFEGGGADYESSQSTYAARFELTGDDIDLVPEFGVETSGPTDGTLTVRTADYADGEPGMAVTVAPADCREPRALVTEEALRYPGVRNTLSYFAEESVSTVRHLSRNRVMLTPGWTDDVECIEYEGETYELRSERVPTETSRE